MSNSDYLPDYPLNSDLVKRLKSALDAKDEERVGDLICTEVTPVDAVIELANDDWMKDPSAQLPPGMLLGNQNEPAASGTLLLSYADGWADPGGRGANVWKKQMICSRISDSRTYVHTRVLHRLCTCVCYISNKCKITQKN